MLFLSKLIQWKIYQLRTVDLLLIWRAQRQAGRSPPCLQANSYWQDRRRRAWTGTFPLLLGTFKEVLRDCIYKRKEDMKGDQPCSPSHSTSFSISFSIFSPSHSLHIFLSHLPASFPYYCRLMGVGGNLSQAFASILPQPYCLSVHRQQIYSQRPHVNREPVLSRIKSPHYIAATGSK